MNVNNLHLLRPELTFRESFRVSGKLKRNIKACIVCWAFGLVIGVLACLGIFSPAN